MISNIFFVELMKKKHTKASLLQTEVICRPIITHTKVSKSKTPGEMAGISNNISCIELTE